MTAVEGPDDDAGSHNVWAEVLYVLYQYRVLLLHYVPKKIPL